MELAALKGIDWSFNSTDVASGRAGGTFFLSVFSSFQSLYPFSPSLSLPYHPVGSAHYLCIRQRFHFSSALARMSTIVTCDSLPDKPTLALVKGAPEVIQVYSFSSCSSSFLLPPSSLPPSLPPPPPPPPPFFSLFLLLRPPSLLLLLIVFFQERLSFVPEQYARSYMHFAKQGKRVIALAYKKLSINYVGPASLINVNRDDIEVWASEEKKENEENGNENG